MNDTDKILWRFGEKKFCLVRGFKEDFKKCKSDEPRISIG